MLISNFSIWCLHFKYVLGLISVNLTTVSKSDHSNAGCYRDSHWSFTNRRLQSNNSFKTSFQFEGQFITLHALSFNMQQQNLDHLILSKCNNVSL